MDLSAPIPPISNATEDKKLRENDMRKICKQILEKHLDGRKYVEDKVKKWGELIISDIEKELKSKYKEFTFGIAFYILDKKNAYNSNDNSILYNETDINFVETFYTVDIYSEIRIYANKKHSKRKDFLNNISPDEIVKINQIISESLDDRKYIYEKCSKYIENLVNDINKFLLSRKNRPCSWHICYINPLPLKSHYFTYKFVDLEYMPLFFTYSNNSLLCRVNLFIVNN